MTCSAILRAGAATVLLVLVACGSGTPKLVPVRGKVFYQGAPLHGGSIVFTPDAERGGSGPLAHAEIQADGSYTLRTDHSPGAVPGWHRVSVMAVQAEGARHRLLLPRRYSDPEMSGLRHQVKPDRANTIDIHLE
jgi:hypothetical protein